MKGVVKQSLNELQNSVGGCVKFMESTQSHFIEVHAENKGCFAMIGFQGGRSQYLNLQNPWCMNSRGTIKHEFIHALGFMHTHMRKDRDSQIQIAWNNVQSNRMSL